MEREGRGGGGEGEGGRGVERSTCFSVCCGVVVAGERKAVVVGWDSGIDHIPIVVLRIKNTTNLSTNFFQPSRIWWLF